MDSKETKVSKSGVKQEAKEGLASGNLEKEVKLEKLIFDRRIVTTQSDAVFEAEIKYIAMYMHKTYMLLGRVQIGGSKTKKGKTFECGKMFGYWPCQDISGEDEKEIKKQIILFLKENYLKGEINKYEFLGFAHGVLLKVLGKTEHERFLVDNPEY